MEGDLKMIDVRVSGRKVGKVGGKVWLGMCAYILSVVNSVISCSCSSSLIYLLITLRRPLLHPTQMTLDLPINLLLVETEFLEFRDAEVQDILWAVLWGSSSSSRR